MSKDSKGTTRRTALVVGAVGAAALAARAMVGQEPAGGALVARRMPTAFVPHAGGPVGQVDFGLPPAEVAAWMDYWRSLRDLPRVRPKAVLVVSAHWEATVPTVMSSPSPPMYYDYGGFPEAAYQIRWPAPGDPQLAARVRALLEGAGFKTAEDSRRGFDHGTFVPLMPAFPAEVPVVQLSLKAGLDPAEHLRMGEALAPLRDEGVFIVGSGDTFHNMRGFSSSSRVQADQFSAWLTQVVAGEPAARAAKLLAWSTAPFARFCHPREEHLIPLLVVAGAAGADAGAETWSGTFMGPRQVGYHFG